MQNKKVFLSVALLLTSSVTLFAQTAAELLEQGHDAYLDYRFEEASKYYSQAKKKAKKNDSQFDLSYSKYLHQLNEAENYLNRIEKLIIIDSISVPRQNFFKYYRIPSSAGKLGESSDLPFSDKSVNYVFSNENNDYKLWAEPDSLGRMQIMESSFLTDGKWSEPSSLNLTEGGGDAIYPFLMADGVTLYYADNGENSIGGYDIMVATRDAADGSFLQPSNIGFPYNSPYDDYLLAIDELNGVGWWATDRNQLGDDITIYVFLVNDLRENYSPDEEDLIQFARIEDYIATQPEDSDYRELLSVIQNIEPSKTIKKPEFTLPSSNGKIFYLYEDLPDNKSRSAMKRYMEAKAELDKDEMELQSIRKRYHDYPSDSLGSRIRKEESAIENKRKYVENLLNEVYKTL